MAACGGPARWSSSPASTSRHGAAAHGSSARAAVKEHFSGACAAHHRAAAEAARFDVIGYWKARQTAEPYWQQFYERRGFAILPGPTPTPSLTSPSTCCIPRARART
ncbi:unnamed protein product [Prorocentrum cordatum]|uniref:Uncharacterized protein n=1 Tax=Prorocentrum cordatum TaxID=2364126 RepID=A0ABN9V424_9DINO|nr:unnamed protein product [Polarella glacialis]